MVDRPILRLPSSRDGTRQRSGRRTQPAPRSPGRATQTQRFQPTFDRLSLAFQGDDPAVTLRHDANGIAPDRALVFVVATQIQNFARAARDLGLEVLGEAEAVERQDLPEGFVPTQDGTRPIFYTTMPTLESLQLVLTLWRAYGRGETPPRGAAPWWRLFDLLLDLRLWGPEDRFPESAREIVRGRLPPDDLTEVRLELEIWPTADAQKRAQWRSETQTRVREEGGRILDQSSISEDGFSYEAVLAALPAGVVRRLVEEPFADGGLATVEGIQFILPQTIAQAPVSTEHTAVTLPPPPEFDPNAPIRAVLLDGAAVAAHPALDGGLAIEDINDLVRLSTVRQRFHGTAMASLILRGDLLADGIPVPNSRLLSVPVLVDDDEHVSSPIDRLFLDVLHTTLVELFSGEEIAADAFVVNLSIGISDQRFAGSVSSLARLLDWWAATEGVLFIVSAGNISERVLLAGITHVEFEDAPGEERQSIVRESLREQAHGRTLLAPSEALNALCIGAVSEDLHAHEPPAVRSIFRIENGNERLPAISSAVGLGPLRSIKPDFLTTGGVHEFRAWPADTATSLNLAKSSQRRGLYVAHPRFGDGQVLTRTQGTSCSAALTTRAILQSAHALTSDEGPFSDHDIPRADLALMTRALAINASHWEEEAQGLYAEFIAEFGGRHHIRAREEVARYFGYGVLDASRMIESPEFGATLVGIGAIRKDQAKIFDLPLPGSLSGDRVPRSMRVTLAWFSPVDPTRARYRLAKLEAVCADEDDDERDSKWGLLMRPYGPAGGLITRGTVWSRRLVHDRAAAPAFEEDATIPIRVQCSDSSGGGLDPDRDIRFAIAVTLEVEAEVDYSVYNEVREKVGVRLLGGLP